MKLKIFLACVFFAVALAALARTRSPHVVIIEAGAGIAPAGSSMWHELMPEGYRFIYAYGGPKGALDGLADIMSSNGYVAARSLADSTVSPLFVEMRVESPEALYSVVTALKRSGSYADALVILTAEGGDTPYHDSWHIPMIIKLPASKRSTLPLGSIVADQVTTADIPPTLLQAAGIKSRDLTGESLLPLIRRKAKAWRHYVYFVNDEYIALTDGRFKYICHRDGSGEELYNLLVDPLETENIADRRSILLGTMREAAAACR